MDISPRPYDTEEYYDCQEPRLASLSPSESGTGQAPANNLQDALADAMAQSVPSESLDCV